mgnify:CR=1 FL=1
MVMTFYTVEKYGLRYCMVNGKPEFLPVEPVQATHIRSAKIALTIAQDYDAEVEVNTLTTIKYEAGFVAKDDYIDYVVNGQRVGFIYWSAGLGKFGWCLLPEAGKPMQDPEYADHIDQAKGLLLESYYSM